MSSSTLNRLCWRGRAPSAAVQSGPGDQPRGRHRAFRTFPARGAGRGGDAEIGAETAYALAYIVIEPVLHRRVPMGTAHHPAEPGRGQSRRLLPASLACEAAQLAVAGALEPADHVGGGTFDYVIDRDTVQLSVTDAMGHDVDAALLATLAVGALRRARRLTPTSPNRPRQADQAMREHGHKGYVTGRLLRISLIDGTTEFINAGHPWPLRMRNGSRRGI